MDENGIGLSEFLSLLHTELAAASAQERERQELARTLRVGQPGPSFMVKQLTVEANVSVEKSRAGGGTFKVWVLSADAQLGSKQATSHKVSIVMEPAGTELVLGDGTQLEITPRD